MAKLGAQTNVEIGGFLSVAFKTVYAQDAAASNQEKIDILCFYEEEGGNYIAIAAPGTGINGIFTGESAPENWTVKNQTYFTVPATELSIEQFDQLADGDAIIQGYYDETVTSGNRKVKNLKINDIYAFKTADGTFGIFKVMDVSQGVSGYVELEYKTK
ncbi:MAG: hypothetical protein Q8S18_08325 [Bacteroidales bacterium]|nr:hypothetical protein [Bacteroidales bacterium]